MSENVRIFIIFPRCYHRTAYQLLILSRDNNHRPYTIDLILGLCLILIYR